MRNVLIISAIVCFALATFGAGVPVVQLVPLGLAFLAASSLA